MSKRHTTFALILASACLTTAATAAPQGHGTPVAGVGSGSTHPAAHPASAPAPGPLSPAVALDQNSKLADKLAAFFPAGTNLTEQASGFKNLGQFVSSVHVAHNLGISFADLKCTELGTAAATSAGTVCTGAIGNPIGVPLGKAIQQLKPGTNFMHAIQDANRQGEADFDGARSGAKS